VSDLPGTTRDAVDEDFIFHGKRITVIDTAGMRKTSRDKDNNDYYSLTRAEESIRRCDVVVHLIDAQAGLTETDKKISDSILAAWKPVIVALNKWDAIEKNQRTFLEFKERLVFQYYRVEDFPVIAVSAREKQRIHKLITTALDLQEKAGRTVETPRLNKIIEDVQRFHRSPLLGDRLKIYYVTQTGSRPPRFRLFVNRPELFRKDVMRFLEKTLARNLEISGVPIMLSVEGRKRS
jgi:GTP-binding protein